MALVFFNHKLIFAALLFLGMWAFQATSRTLDQLSSMSARHEQWMAHHGRVYKDQAEKERRFKIFQDNVEFIESSNNAGTRPYKLAVNEFADLTNEEFHASRNGFRQYNNSKLFKTTLFKYENVSQVPSSIDWRQYGAVTAIKDQGNSCACCWAFSAVAATEGLYQLKTGNLVSLSEQELLDCTIEGNHGCNGGGFMNAAFKFIISNNGLTTETNYPYLGYQGTCDTEKAASQAATITGYEDVPANSESALLQAVANQPVSVAIDASGSAFKGYRGGVFTGDCGNQLNHAVTAVGYGTSDDGTKYWLVKNSWGTNWGEDGYMRILRDSGIPGGLCGIAMMASYPTA